MLVACHVGFVMGNTKYKPIKIGQEIEKLHKNKLYLAVDDTHWYIITQGHFSPKTSVRQTSFCPSPKKHWGRSPKINIHLYLVQKINVLKYFKNQLISTKVIMRKLTCLWTKTLLTAPYHNTTANCGRIKTKGIILNLTIRC